MQRSVVPQLVAALVLVTPAYPGSALAMCRNLSVDELKLLSESKLRGEYCMAEFGRTTSEQMADAYSGARRAPSAPSAYARTQGDHETRHLDEASTCTEMKLRVTRVLESRFGRGAAGKFRCEGLNAVPTSNRR
jgi:hypothetical protein